MLIVKINRVEHFKSKKGNDVHMAWFSRPSEEEDKVASKDDTCTLPSKYYCPDWVTEGMLCGLRIVPDYRCNSSFEFVKIG